MFAGVSIYRFTAEDLREDVFEVLQLPLAPFVDYRGQPATGSGPGVFAQKVLSLKELKTRSRADEYDESLDDAFQPALYASQKAKD